MHVSSRREGGRGAEQTDKGLLRAAFVNKYHDMYHTSGDVALAQKLVKERKKVQQVFIRGVTVLSLGGDVTATVDLKQQAKESPADGRLLTYGSTHEMTGWTRESCFP